MTAPDVIAQDFYDLHRLMFGLLARLLESKGIATAEEFADLMDELAGAIERPRHADSQLLAMLEGVAHSMRHANSAAPKLTIIPGGREGNTR